jgi:hypothetical protein
MKTIGLLLLAIILAVGAMGIGYAHWSDTVYINGTVETGMVRVGIVDQDSNDDGIDDNGVDPIWPEADWPVPCGWLAPDDPEGKDVATANCILSEQKICCDGETLLEHDNDPCYEVMSISLNNTYPNYAPSFQFHVANCGSIPVHVVGAWIIDGPTELIPDPTDPLDWIALCKGVWTDLDLDGDGLADVNICLEDYTGGEPQQIHPCNTREYRLHFHIKQDYVQCNTYNFKIKLHAQQYNLSFVFPDDLPENGP